MMTAGQHNPLGSIVSPNDGEVQHRDCAEQHNGEEQLLGPQSIHSSERIVPMVAPASPPITIFLH